MITGTIVHDWQAAPGQGWNGAATLGEYGRREFFCLSVPSFVAGPDDGGDDDPDFGD